MFCPKCGFQVADGARFCPKCGCQMPETSQGTAHDQSQLNTPHVNPPRKFPLIPIAIVGVLVVVIGAFVALGFMGIGPIAGLLRGGTGAVSEEPGHTQGNYSSNISVGYGYGVSDNDYDYFISYRGGGICRAKWNGDSSETETIYPITIDEHSYSYASFLNIDDGWLYFCEFTYDYDNSGKQTQKLVRVRTDGSDAETIHEFETVDVDDANYNVSAVYLFDSKLYVLITNNASDVNGVVYQVVSMNEDGSDIEELGEVQVDGYAYFVLTPDRIYYAATPTDSSSSTQSKSTIYAQDLDGSNMSVIYESDIGTISALAYKDGRLYFEESTSTINYQKLVSVAVDGSDVQRLYEAPAQTGVYIGMYADDKAYLIAYDNSEGYAMAPSYMVAVPLSGNGETSQVDFPADGFNVMLLNAGDHMIILIGGGDVASLGYEVWGMSFDGSEEKTYVAAE